MPKLKSAVALDDWKLPKFEAVLQRHGISYEVDKGITADTRTIFIEFDESELPRITAIVRECNTAAAVSKN